MLAEIEEEHHRHVASLHQTFSWQNRSVGRSNAFQRGRQSAVSLAAFPDSCLDCSHVKSIVLAALQQSSRVSNLVERMFTSTLALSVTVHGKVRSQGPKCWMESKEGMRPGNACL